MAVAITRGRDRNPIWVNVEAWGELGDQVAHHLKKGSQVRVVGKLKLNEWTNRDGEKRNRQVVAANEIATVVRPADGGGGGSGGGGGGLGRSFGSSGGASASMYPQMPPPSNQGDTPQFGAPQNGWDGGAGAGAGMSAGFGDATKAEQAEEMWALLLRDEDAFYDNRVTKRNPRGPDFVHKSSRFGLWLDSAPGFARDALNDAAAPA